MSDSENTYRLPKRINEPLILIIWPIQQVIPVFFSMGMGYAVGNMMYFILIGISWFFVYGHILKNFEPGYLMKFLWRKGMTAGFTKESTTVPDPMTREFYQ